MNSKKYIVSKINALAKNFPSVKFSYQMDELSETHFIEVLPKDFFEQYESDFVKEQNKIVLDFISKYPSEGLAFITEGDLFAIENPEYVKYGKHYPGLIPNLSWNHKNLTQLLTDYCVDMQEKFVFNQEIREVKQSAISCKFSFTENDTELDFQTMTNNLPSSTIGVDMIIVEDISNEQAYYLAA